MAIRRESQPLGERIPISLKFPKTLLNAIDEVWKQNPEYTGRTHFIEVACQFFLRCERCPRCDTLNTPESNICSHCGTPLNSTEKFQEIVTEIGKKVDLIEKTIQSIISYRGVYDEINSKINLIAGRLDGKKKDVVRYILPENHSSLETAVDRVDQLISIYTYCSELDFVSTPDEVLRNLYPELSKSAKHDDVPYTADELYTMSYETPIFLQIIQYIDVVTTYFDVKHRLSNLSYTNTQTLENYLKALDEDIILLQSVLNEMSKGVNNIKALENMVDALREI